MMTRFLFTFLLISLSAPAFAQAQSPYKGGLNYTTAGQKNATHGKNFIRHKDIQPIEGASSQEDTAAAAAQASWEKYKALAAGTQNAPPAVKSLQPEPPKVQSTAKPSVGFGGVIQKYQQNKAQRSQMRTLKRPKE